MRCKGKKIMVVLNFSQPCCQVDMKKKVIFVVLNIKRINMEKIAQLEPQRLWYYFLEICKIPRPSKKEEQIAGWLMEFGKANGLETLRDETGNVLIRKPAVTGMKSLNR